jgi:hypothetical protein
MSLKVFLFLAPVALGGYYVASGRDAATPGSAETARAAARASPPRKSLEECRQLEQRMLEDNQASSPTDNPLVAIRNLSGMARELERQGCNPGEANRVNGPFQPPSNRMGNAPPGAGAPQPDGVSFEPGRPMVDVGHNSGR